MGTSGYDGVSRIINGKIGLYMERISTTPRCLRLNGEKLDFDAKEAALIRAYFGNLISVEGGFVFDGLCPFLTNNKCSLRGDQREPFDCRYN